jgi:hypothetical protein
VLQHQGKYATLGALARLKEDGESRTMGGRRDTTTF